MMHWAYNESSEVHEQKEVVVLMTDEIVLVLDAEDFVEIDKFDMQDLKSILLITENSSLCIL